MTLTAHRVGDPSSARALAWVGSAPDAIAQAIYGGSALNPPMIVLKGLRPIPSGEIHAFCGFEFLPYSLIFFAILAH
jgi:hypothetical protein